MKHPAKKPAPKTVKQSIAFRSAEQKSEIQEAVNYLIKIAEVGGRTTFNSFVIDAATKEAKRILKAKGKRK